MSKMVFLGFAARQWTAMAGDGLWRWKPATVGLSGPRGWFWHLHYAHQQSILHPFRANGRILGWTRRDVSFTWFSRRAWALYRSSARIGMDVTDRETIWPGQRMVCHLDGTLTRQALYVEALPCSLADVGISSVCYASAETTAISGVDRMVSRTSYVS